MLYVSGLKIQKRTSLFLYTRKDRVFGQKVKYIEIRNDKILKRKAKPWLGYHSKFLN